ncbi:MAG: hypothetical protein FWC96_05585 [Oscillospiraceae bacterium]|nr:hypothetical protein [Oscillospiraceae bacterium]
MADYKEMYLELFRAVTDAINLLQKAQQKAEETYISHDDTKILTILNDELTDGTK